MEVPDASIPAPVLQTDLPLARVGRGKVRDIYAVDDQLLIVASDRISAFDHVLASGIPDKGRVLTQLAAFRFERLAGVVPHHVVSLDLSRVPGLDAAQRALLTGRAMLVRRASPLPIECVARGYLSGSGWKDYQRTGAICGITLPAGLKESERLPEPLFTPATKATSGHDLNISEAEAATIVGPELLGRLRTLTLALYARAAEFARTRGILVADTKFEFGLIDGREGTELLLIDEALTPDSSRFWPAASYAPGGSQPSFDKQFVRDYLEKIRWNKQPPVPSLPPDVVAKTREKYLEVFRRLTDRELVAGRDAS